MAATSAGQPGCGDVAIKQQQQQHQQQQQSSIIVSQAMPVSAFVTSSHQVSQQPPSHMPRNASYMQQRMPNSSTSSSSSHLQHPHFIDNNNFTNTGAVTCQSSSSNLGTSYHSEQNRKSSVESGTGHNVIVNYNLAPSWKRLIHNKEVVYVR